MGAGGLLSLGLSSKKSPHWASGEASLKYLSRFLILSSGSVNTSFGFLSIPQNKQLSLENMYSPFLTSITAIVCG